MDPLALCPPSHRPSHSGEGSQYSIGFYVVADLTFLHVQLCWNARDVTASPKEWAQVSFMSPRAKVSPSSITCLKREDVALRGKGFISTSSGPKKGLET